MAVLRIDIERALDELISQENGMRFQGLAVALGRQRWPQLVAHPRKKDFGLDAYAPASQTPELIGKGLAASITPTLKKISDDVQRANEYFDLGALLFVTPTTVGTAEKKRWEKAILDDYRIELIIFEREHIITQMLEPENASLRASFLYLKDDTQPSVEDLVFRARRAATTTNHGWSRRTKGHPLIDLTAVELDLSPPGSVEAEPINAFALEQIGRVLSHGGRIVLEGPAGRGKTTALVRLARGAEVTSIPFMVDLPAWVLSRQTILHFMAGMPAFQAEGLTQADLAKVQQTEPFLFLLNGWNEISEGSSDWADAALRELERGFPSAGIIVATRSHHLAPPLPGALQLLLSRVQRHQRSEYLETRLGADAKQLQDRIAGDLSLDELTLTPFILSEVVSLYEADANIPSTKMGVITQVIAIQEQRDEHKNALQMAPLFGRQTDYLEALATKMTRSGAVSQLEADARALVGTVAHELMNAGQVERAGAPAILAALSAHHVLERVEYPEITFRFDHQQYQEYYAARYVRTCLLSLVHDENPEEDDRFADRYVNSPSWSESLCMIAASLGETANIHNVHAGVKLVNMAFQVDLLFACELSHLCGDAVWRKVRETLGNRLRAMYATSDRNYQHYAIAAMFATGADEFRDITVPLLSSEDRRTRMWAYGCGRHMHTHIHLSSLGPNWGEEVRGWGETARTDFVSELLHHRPDGDIASFASEDESAAVKKAATFGLIWTGAEEALTKVLKTMDMKALQEVARAKPDRLPQAIRPDAIAALRKIVEISVDPRVRLQTALSLVDLGEPGVDGVVKDALSAIPEVDVGELRWDFIVPALQYLHEVDPAWTSEWVAAQVAEGPLYAHEQWLPFVTAIPGEVVETYLKRLENEDLGDSRPEGMIAVIAARSDPQLVVRVFARLRDLMRRVAEKPGQHHEIEWRVIRQLEALIHRLPGNTVADGILRCVSNGDPLDIRAATKALSRVCRRHLEPLRIADDDLRNRLRQFIQNGVNVILRRDDFSGDEKADLASCLSQVGEPEDMPLLVDLIHADIERMRRGRAALVAGDRGPLGNGGVVLQAGWLIDAVLDLDRSGACTVLIELLPEPEYSSDVASAMAREFMLKSDHVFGRPLFPYDMMWTAREGRSPSYDGYERRKRFSEALKAEIEQRKEQDKEQDAGIVRLATALATIDGYDSAEIVLEAIATPSRWEEYSCVVAAERLLIAGVVLPVETAIALIDSVLERTEHWMQDSDRYLLCRVLALLPLVDNPEAGIAKARSVVGSRRLRGNELHELVTSLGESRSDAAVDLLCELARDVHIFGGTLVNALTALDTPRAREALLGCVDPDLPGVVLGDRSASDDVLVARLAELARRVLEVDRRLRELCELNLPENSRHVLSRVMCAIATPEALLGNLNLIDDARRPPVPRGVLEQLESVFVQREPQDTQPNVFTLHARASNNVRDRLFRMALKDRRRQQSAFSLLGQIEVWRLDYGKPTDEPRHPDLSSGLFWPMASSDINDGEIL